MIALVLDASVAAKWVLPRAGEALVDQANEILRQAVDGEIDLLVPDLFWSEIGNIVWKAVRRQRMTAAQAKDSVDAAQSWAFTTIAAKQLYNAALGISLRYDRTFYDGVYLALALDSNATLITADERLANATAAYLPVKWLGAV